MESKNRLRDYLFDNYKVLLIILVIFGHFTEPSYRNNDFLYTLKWLIVSFHMPAFIFISGYFSKRELTFAKLFQKQVIPYLIYEFIYYFFYIYDNTHLDYRDKKLLAACVFFWCFMRYSGIIDVLK